MRHSLENLVSWVNFTLISRSLIFLPTLMISIDFVNHLKPRGVEFLKTAFKNIWRPSAFNRKSEDTNSNDFRTIFDFVFANVRTRRSYVTIQQHFQRI